MNMYREEVMNKQTYLPSWPEAQINTLTEGNIAMAEDIKNPFDLEFETKPEQGKSCHMQVDPDLHAFLKQEHTKLGVTFRKFANELLCRGIQQYIKAKKLSVNVRNRSKY